MARSSKRPAVLVSTLADFARAFPDHDIPEAFVTQFGARIVYVHLDDLEDTLFESVLESSDDSYGEELTDLLLDHAHEHEESILEQLGRAGAEEVGYDVGIHLDATYEEAVKCFEKDGFEVRKWDLAR
jgi:hypothetical protein